MTIVGSSRQDKAQPVRQPSSLRHISGILESLNIEGFFSAKIQFLTSIYVTLLSNSASPLCLTSGLIALVVNAYFPKPGNLIARDSCLFFHLIPYLGTAGLT